MDTKRAILKAISLAGGQVALGAKIGRPQQTISWWVRTGVITPEDAIPIERAVDGQVRRCELAPRVHLPGDCACYVCMPSAYLKYRARRHQYGSSATTHNAPGV